MLKIGLDIASKIPTTKKLYRAGHTFSNLRPLANDVFQNASSSGDNHLVKAIKKGHTLTFSKSNNTPLYKISTRFGEKIERVYSLDGDILYEIIHKKDGTSIKRVFDKGEKIKFSLKLSKDGCILDKIPHTSDASNEASVKLPEYFYHFTSAENYNAILRDRAIKAGTDCHLSQYGNKAIFFVDIDNLLNQWANMSQGAEQSYLTRLLKFCNKNKEGKVVMLRIPTSKLNTANMAYRNQDAVMESFPEYRLPKNKQKEFFEFLRLLKESSCDTRSARKIARDVFMPDKMNHLCNGANISDLEDFSSFPLEILYKGDIPSEAIDNIEIIDISKLADIALWNKEGEDISRALIQKALI